METPLYIHREVKESVSRAGNLSSFYYEQIDSERVLLEYYKSNEMTDMYEYELNKYVRVLFRIACLDDSKEIYDRIKLKIRQYKKEILKSNTVSLVNKAAIVSIQYCPSLCRWLFRFRDLKYK